MPLKVYAKFDQKPSYRLGDRARTNGRTDGRTERCFQYTPLPYGRGYNYISSSSINVFSMP